jgi:hypothetical protein
MQGVESKLRHPAERPLFLVYAVLNVLLMAASIFIVVKGSDWVRVHPRLAHYQGKVRVLAIAAIVALPMTVFLRNTRHALDRGKSIAISREQLPEIYTILERHCRKLGIEALPELYFTDMTMKKPAQAYKSWKCDYIVLSSKFLQPNLQPMLPVFAFWLGCAIGCLRLKHVSWPTEFMLTYVDKIPHLSNPLRRLFTYSEDRYGAFLAPEGLPGLIAAASGRLMLPQVNTADYLKQVRAYGGVWAGLAMVMEPEPTIARRTRALLAAGLLNTELSSPMEEHSKLAS